MSRIASGIDRTPLVSQQAGKWESPGEAGTCPGAHSAILAPAANPLPPLLSLDRFSSDAVLYVSLLHVQVAVCVVVVVLLWYMTRVGES